jgi:hypothetical protein
MSDNILKQRRPEPEPARSIRASMAFTEELAMFVQSALDRGVPPYRVARALREVEGAVQEWTRQKRGYRKPGPKPVEENDGELAAQYEMEPLWRNDDAL